MTETLRVLPPDVYDALELSALAYGGIGAFTVGTEEKGPVCVLGHVRFLAGVPLASWTPSMNADYVALRNAVPVGPYENDAAVARINRRRDKPESRRVSFADWCAELGVVRGEAAQGAHAPEATDE